MSAVEQLITEHLDVWTSAIERKSSTGRGGGKKVSLHGIAKLRELILDLAVKGKLVPQDPNDEPAAVVISKIPMLKQEFLAKHKVTKKQNKNTDNAAHPPFEIPASWEWTDLDYIGFSQTGGTPKKSESHHYGDFIPFIRPADLKPNVVEYNNEGLSKVGETGLGRTAHAGSLLMVCIGTIGKCQLIDRPCAFNQQINAITPYADISNFLFLACSSKYFRDLAWAESSSTTIAILNKRKWTKLPVPLPPLAEQKRIVAKVDELMALCDQLESHSEASLHAHQQLVTTLLDTLTASANNQELLKNWQRLAHHFDTLFTTPESIDQLKQTILQLAVMGKLVAQDPNDEPASELLKRIAKENGTKPKKAPGNTDIGELFQVPSSWEWTTLRSISDNCLGKMLDKQKNTGKLLPYLRNKNVQWYEIDTDDVKEMRFTKDDFHKYDVQKNDVLVCEGGYPGRCAVWTKDHSIMFQKALHRIRFKSACYLPVLLVHYFFHLDASDKIKTFFTGAGIQHLTGKSLNKIPVPVPPLAEQKRIVAKVDELMALCDQLSARISEAETTQLHLANAITEQAPNAISI